MWPSKARSGLRYDRLAPMPRPYPAPSGASGSGSLSTSQSLQRRLVSPEAIAGLRCLLALRPPPAVTLGCLAQCLPERLVRSHEVLIRRPPVQIGKQLPGRLQGRPGPTCQGRDALPQRPS